MADRSRVFIASDHAGFALKETLKQALPGIEWVDLGPDSDARVDYPDYADRLAKKMKAAQSSAGAKNFNSPLRAPSEPRGLLICGSGQGMAIRANRYKHLRAALCWDEDTTRLSREHNDANVLCLGARHTPVELAAQLVGIFMKTSFEGGRHQGRVAKLAGLSEC